MCSAVWSRLVRARELLSRQVTRIECRVPLLTVPCSDTSSYGELIFRASEQQMKSRVNGKKREFEGERKPGIKVWQSLNFLDWRLKFRASRLVLYTWEHILFQLKYGLRRKTTYFACDTGSINYNRHLFICHHSCLLESRFGEEFQYRLLSFFCFSWVILQTSGDYYHTVIGKTNTTQFQSTFASFILYIYALLQPKILEVEELDHSCICEREKTILNIATVVLHYKANCPGLCGIQDWIENSN